MYPAPCMKHLCMQTLCWAMGITIPTSHAHTITVRPHEVPVARENSPDPDPPTLSEHLLHARPSRGPRPAAPGSQDGKQTPGPVWAQPQVRGGRRRCYAVLVAHRCTCGVSGQEEAYSCPWQSTSPSQRFKPLVCTTEGMPPSAPADHLEIRVWPSASGTTALGQEAWPREGDGGFCSKPWLTVWLSARPCPSLGTSSSQHSTAHWTSLHPALTEQPEAPGGSDMTAGHGGQRRGHRLSLLPQEKGHSLRLGRRFCCPLAWRGEQISSLGPEFMSARSMTTPTAKSAMVDTWRFTRAPAVQHLEPPLVPRCAQHAPPLCTCCPSGFSTPLTPAPAEPQKLVTLMGVLPSCPSWSCQPLLRNLSGPRTGVGSKGCGEPGGLFYSKPPGWGPYQTLCARGTVRAGAAWPR